MVKLFFLVKLTLLKQMCFCSLVPLPIKDPNLEVSYELTTQEDKSLITVFITLKN